FLSFGMLLTILFLLLTSLVVSTIIQSALGVDKKEKAALVETKDSVAAGDVKAADPATQASASTTSPAATPATAPAAEIKKDEEIKKSLLSEAINLIVSFGVFILLFAAMFRYLPDVKIAWSDVWVGAVLTSILFVIGKWGLGIYLGRSASDTDNAYATAVASFVAFLLWVYYSGIIVLIGAEATQVYARHKGHGLEPDEHAVLVEKRNVTLESGNANG
ncbi:MAG TPA: YihY/virulence factor BrkB family protein, partial [Tepidisphaeraceae bacterium]